MRADLSHISSRAKVRAFTGAPQLGGALSGCDVVLIPAGVPRKPGQTRDDLFKVNAGIVRSVCGAVAAHCPRALVLVISNPVNSTVPAAASALAQAGVYDPRRLFGVTTLDVMRARTFLAESVGVDPSAVDVPVVGGHAGATIVPLFTQAAPVAFALEPGEAAALSARVQNGGTEVVEAKAGGGSATLSMAAAAAEFADACMRALLGEPGLVACAYVASGLTEAPFFASRVLLGRGGVEAVLPLGPLGAAERAAVAKAMPELLESIAKGSSSGSAA